MLLSQTKKPSRHKIRKLKDRCPLVAQGVYKHLSQIYPDVFSLKIKQFELPTTTWHSLQAKRSNLVEPGEVEKDK